MGKKIWVSESVIAANTHRAQGKSTILCTFKYVMPRKSVGEVDCVPPDEEAEAWGGALSNLPQYHKVSMCRG